MKVTITRQNGNDNLTPTDPQTDTDCAEFLRLLSSAVSFLLQGQTLVYPVTVIYKLPVADTTRRQKAEAAPCLAFE